MSGAGSLDRRTCRSCGAFIYVWEGPECDACDPIVNEGHDDEDFVAREALGRIHPPGNRAP